MKATLHSGQLVVSGEIALSRGLGFSRIEGDAEQFFAGSAQDVLATIAVTYWHPAVERMNAYVTAVNRLALYAAGCDGVEPSKQEFRRLERKLKEYAGILLADEFDGALNHRIVRFVLRHAVARAKGEGLI